MIFNRSQQVCNLRSWRGKPVLIIISCVNHTSGGVANPAEAEL